MAHFAKINDEKLVLTVLTLNNSNMLDSNNVESESVGQAYLEKHNNWPADKWIQTSYNTAGGTHTLGGTPFRGNFAGTGFTWDDVNNIFWGPKPHASWVQDTSDAQWHSPIGDAPALTPEQASQTAAGTHRWVYSWNEGGQSWDLADILV